MQEPLFSIIGGGLAAAVVTAGFNYWWDKQKERNAQDWEFRRYRANLVHAATFGLLEAFISAKTEITYLVSILATLAGQLDQLSAQADQIVRHQVGPQLTVAELERRKSELLQPSKLTTNNKSTCAGTSTNRRSRIWRPRRRAT